MSTTLLLLLSAALIVSGLSLAWRDLYAARRSGGAALSPDAQQPVGAARAARPEPISSSRPAVVDAAPPRLGDKLGALLAPGRAGRVEPEQPKPDAARPAATAQHWAALQTAINSAVERVNAVLAQAGLTIGNSDEPTWGANRSFGANRPVEARGRAFARLRLECTPGGQLDVSVVAVDEKLAGEINSEASAPASGASIGRVSDLLSECLKPATAYALRHRGETGRRAQEGDWRAIEPTVIAAMKVANGALVEAGARLVPVATPVWDPAQGLHRMPVSVQMFGRDIARMHVDRLGEEMEVAVGMPDARLANLGRRERLAVEGMTAHTLAELITSCAWPAIAYDRETRPLG